MTIQLIHGDCLEVMQSIPDRSVDMVLCDLPYEKTARNGWDIMIPLVPLWQQYHRIIKPNGAIVLNAMEPFTSMLVMSNLSHYRHKWVWNKNNSAGFANANKQPFQITEDVLVFGLNRVNYYPIMEERGKPRKKGGYSASTNYHIITKQSVSNLYYPKNLLEYSSASQVGKQHPTQKPVGLCEYLVKTYTNSGELVLDNCMGSGTTGEACKNLGRNFIGIEKDEKYFEIARNRLGVHI